MTKKLSLIIIAVAVLISGVLLVPTFFPQKTYTLEGKTIEERFNYLSQHGNSSCSTGFKDSISMMDHSMHLQGSCCSQMSMHRYQQQVEGLKKYNNIREIPPDPYDISAELAQRMMGYYDLSLSQAEQAAYDYAMEHSEEKGPCCCKCWRWYIYGGLAKYLIKNKGFTGEQITEVWNLSDGCGGEDEHNHE
ncbi:MAG TPA: hypothetical protein VEK36_02215 [Candidatus Paceibacterota bacterium]|nr:hypothetical protein [Candidatus Paceibacterota bacterium]